MLFQHLCWPHFGAVTSAVVVVVVVQCFSLIVALSLMSCCWSCLAILSIPVRDTIKKSVFVFGFNFFFFFFVSTFVFVFCCVNESTDRLLLLYNWILLLNFHLLACLHANPFRFIPIIIHHSVAYLVSCWSFTLLFVSLWFIWFAGLLFFLLKPAVMV